MYTLCYNYTYALSVCQGTVHWRYARRYDPLSELLSIYYRQFFGIYFCFDAKELPHSETVIKGARLLYTYSAHMPSGAKAWESVLSHALAQLYERTLFNSADIGA